MATSTRESASSAANINPVGPPPAITTACFVLVMAMTVRHDPGLPASPHVWYKVEVERDGGRAPLRVRAGPPGQTAARKNTAHRFAPQPCDQRLRSHYIAATTRIPVIGFDSSR